MSFYSNAPATSHARRKSVLPIYGAAALAISALTAPVYAQTIFITEDRTIARGNPLNGNYGDLRVGISSGGVEIPVTADVVSPATVDFLRVWNYSTVNISGGTFNYWNTFENSTVNVTGGIFKRQVDTYHNSSVNVSGGTFNEFFAYGGGVTNISGGSIGSFYTGSLGTVSVSGGTFGTLAAGGSAYDVTVSGGTVNNAMDVYNFGVLHVAGGVNYGNLNAYSASSLLLSGGDVKGSLTAHDDSFVSMSGGAVTDYFGYDNSYFEWTGGTIGPHTLRLFDNSVINIVGTNLHLSSSGVGNDAFGSYVRYYLSGVLDSGQDMGRISLLDYDGGYSISGGVNSPLNFNGVTQAAPEPGALALLALSLPLLGGILAHRTRSVSK